MIIDLVKIKPEDYNELSNFIISEKWKYHSITNTKEQIDAKIKDGYYLNDSTETFWILQKSIPVGFIRIFDLLDATCLFDIRITNTNRGKGIGGSALKKNDRVRLYILFPYNSY